jgi:hypothetical protein
VRYVSQLASRFLDEGMFKVLASTEATILQSTAVKAGWYAPLLRRRG